MKKNINKYDERQDPDFIFWIIIVAIVALLAMCVPTPGHAQAKQPAAYDTVSCKVNCIQKFTTHTTKSGNTSYKAIYVDKENQIFDLIPVSKSTFEYIQMCKNVGIPPSLGIRLKNGEINSIVQIKKKYRRIKNDQN